LLEPMTDDWEMFELTEEGMRYLDGDLDARHQPMPRTSKLTSNKN
jgi:hypothetical protein